MKGTTTGIADVYLDGEFDETVDLSASTASYQVDVWSSGDLADAPHEVRIERSDACPAGKYITIDAVDLAGTLDAGPPTLAVTGLSPRTGSTAGGTSVTITGTLFANVSAVTFGGQAAASWHVDSSTKITAVAPAHAAGAVDVLVTTTAGTSENTSADDFTYVVPPAYTRYDQTNANIVKTGTWTNYTSTPSYLGSYGRSSTSGASATIWFTGTRLDYIAMKGTTTGYAEIWVDGVKVTGSSPINLYASPAVFQRLIYTTGPLADTLHCVRIVRSTASASGKYLTLDAVEIYGEISAPPTRYQQTDSHIAKTGVWSTFTTSSASGGTYI